jgi:hypothetical protein
MNIGITCQLSKSIWSGSIKQSAINLYECLENCGFNPMYLCDSTVVSDFKKDHRAFNINNIGHDKFPHIDILIMHGFYLKNSELIFIKNKYPNIKIVLFYITNRIITDQQNLLSGSNFMERLSVLDEIWLYAHHSNCAQYIKAYHATEATVRNAPFLWSPFYINHAKKTKDLEFNATRDPQILVLEPNNNISKTCLLPLLICETFNRAFKNCCTSFSFFNTDKLKTNKGAKDLVSKFSVSQQDKIFLNKQWKTIDAIDRLGQYILSHTSAPEINYLFLECLHLGIPLIHNSSYIKGYGYYYPGNNILVAANQIYNAITNHTENLDVYKKENNELINSLLPSNQSNINNYKKIISHLQKK